MTSPIFYHALPDKLTDNDLDALLTHCVVIQPRNMIFHVAAKKAQALAWSSRFRDALPQARIIRRMYPDDGRLARHSTGKAAYDEIKQYAADGSALFLDNEPGTVTGLREYAEKTAQAMDAAGQDGVTLVVGGFSTGTPHESQFGELEAMWRAFARWPGLHVWGPHVYDPQNPSAPWHFWRPHWGLLACDALGLPRPETIITEFGVAIDSNPFRGWRETGWLPAKYADWVAKKWKRFYEQFGIDLGIFSYGAWPEIDNDTNGVGPAFMKALETSGPQISDAAPDDAPLREHRLPDERIITSGYRPAPQVIDEPATVPEPEPIPEPIEEKEPMNKRSIVFSIITVLALLFVAGIVTVLAGVPGSGVTETLAQVEPIRDSGPTDLLTASEANLLFDSSINAVAAGAGGSLLVLVIVQLLKFVPQLANVKAADLSTATAFVLVAAGAVANSTGYADTFDSSAAFLQTTTPALVAIITAVLASGGLFNLSKRAGLGDQSFVVRSRTPDAA